MGYHTEESRRVGKATMDRQTLPVASGLRAGTGVSPLGLLWERTISLGKQGNPSRTPTQHGPSPSELQAMHQTRFPSQRTSQGNQHRPREERPSGCVALSVRPLLLPHHPASSLGGVSCEIVCKGPCPAPPATAFLVSSNFSGSLTFDLGSQPGSSSPPHCLFRLNLTHSIFST